MVVEPGLEPDQRYKYFLPLRVRYADTDMQGHVFFGNYLTYFDEALTGYMRAIGVTYADLIAAGADTVYIHSEADYHAPAYFEQVLHIHARVGRIGNTSLDFDFAAFKEQGGDRVATGKVVAVCVDPRSRKPVPVPDAFRRAVEAFESSSALIGSSFEP